MVSRMTSFHLPNQRKDDVFVLLTGLTVAVEELQPVVDPIVGLLSVVLLSHKHTRVTHEGVMKHLQSSVRCVTVNVSMCVAVLQPLNMWFLSVIGVFGERIHVSADRNLKRDKKFDMIKKFNYFLNKNYYISQNNFSLLKIQKFLIIITLNQNCEIFDVKIHLYFFRENLTSNSFFLIIILS